MAVKPARGCKAALEAWAAGLALQWGIQGAAVQVAVQLAESVRKLRIMSMAVPAAARVREAAQPKPRKVLAAEMALRGLLAARVPRQLEQPAWPEVRL